jgi:F-type H+-transporting ATPase subunit c
MRKMFVSSLLTIVMVLVLVPLAFAAKEATAAAPAPAGSAIDYTKAIVVGLSILAAGFSMGFGAIGAGLGLGQATSGASNAVGRNPEAQGKIMMTMMVGMAMTESVAIYALVIALVILYANPLLKVVGL